MRLSHPAAWAPADVAVAGSEVLERRVLAEIGISPTALLRPFAVRDPALFPGVAVFKLPRPEADLMTVAGAMREFAWSRKFHVQEKALTSCVDGAVALGLVATNGTVLQVSWMAYRDDAMYYVLALAMDDGNARTQAQTQSLFSAVVATVRFLA